MAVSTVTLLWLPADCRPGPWRHVRPSRSGLLVRLQVCQEARLHVSGDLLQMMSADNSQTPTFNAVPVVQAALDAVRRGILVEIYADLGFNDEVSCKSWQC